MSHLTQFCLLKKIIVSDTLMQLLNCFGHFVFILFKTAVQAINYYSLVRLGIVWTAKFGCVVNHIVLISIFRYVMLDPINYLLEQGEKNPTCTTEDTLFDVTESDCQIVNLTKLISSLKWQPFISLARSQKTAMMRASLLRHPG